MSTRRISPQYCVCVCGCQEYGPVWKKDTDSMPVVYLQPAHSNVRLRCNADAKPRPKVKWFKNGHQLTNRPSRKVRILLLLF